MKHMRTRMKKHLSIISILLCMMMVLLTGCATGTEGNTDNAGGSESTVSSSETDNSGSLDETEAADTQEDSRVSVTEDGTYTSRDEVAAYLNEFGHLPDNFITKKEAKRLGWVSKEGNLGEVAPGKSIGGDYFGNYEGTLPKVKGREYHECDIDTDGTYRGAKRIIYSNEGQIYYTGDHYETFELLYGEE